MFHHSLAEGSSKPMFWVAGSEIVCFRMELKDDVQFTLVTYGIWRGKKAMKAGRGT
jgi:hypothetical protein